MNDIECPYCSHSFDLDHDDGAYYDTSEIEEAHCPKCDKQFLVSSSVSWNHTGYKADCLNGAPHKWRRRYPYIDANEYPSMAAEQECEDCGTTHSPDRIQPDGGAEG